MKNRIGTHRGIVEFRFGWAMPARRSILPLVLCALLLQGCVFVPHTHVTSDPECAGVQKKMTLATSGDMNGLIALCHGGDQKFCAGLLVGAGVVAATSFVVSGSIAVVGNAVYWVERRASCKDTPA